MKKKLIFQKVMFALFILFVVVSFIYTLGFMTEYQDFQYLFDSANKPLYNFHHEELIPFNNVIFYVSVIGVIMIIVVFIAKLNKVLPKLLNLILGIVAILPLLLTSIYSILELPGIKDTYNTLDFSHVAEEIYDEYNPSTFAFDFGYIFYIISLVFVVIYLITIITNYIVRRRIENV